jgi:hypothetical protein
MAKATDTDDDEDRAHVMVDLQKWVVGVAGFQPATSAV